MLKILTYLTDGDHIESISQGKLAYMNKLHKIWQESPCKQGQGEEEDAVNTSLAESSSTKASSNSYDRKGVLDFSINELDISLEEISVPDPHFDQQQPIGSKQKKSSIVKLANAISVTETKSCVEDGIIKKIVNLKKGYIDIYQFSQMIVQSCRNPSNRIN